MNNIAIQYASFSAVEKLILISLLASLITFVFHKYYKTENKVIYKLFNSASALVLIIFFDIIIIVGNVVYRMDFVAILGEILQVVFIPFLSQSWYDWITTFIAQIKEFMPQIKNIISTIVDKEQYNNGKQ